MSKYEKTYSTNLQRDLRWLKEAEENSVNEVVMRTIADEHIKLVRKKERVAQQEVKRAFELESSLNWSRKFLPSNEDWS